MTPTVRRASAGDGAGRVDHVEEIVEGGLLVQGDASAGGAEGVPPGWRDRLR